MSSRLEVVETSEQLNDKLGKMRETPPEEMTVHNAVAICKLGAGVLRFAQTAFSAGSSSRIYGKHYDREPEGRGAHFDVYDGVADQYHPWIAIYNLAGSATLNAALLPGDLAEAYANRFPEANEEAYQARREFSSIALRSSAIEIATADIDENTGFIIMQRPGGPNIIHDIVPKDKNNPGEFIKFVYPAATEKSLGLAKSDGMVPLDELVTERIKSLEKPLMIESGHSTTCPLPRYLEEDVPDLIKKISEITTA